MLKLSTLTKTFLVTVTEFYFGFPKVNKALTDTLDFRCSFGDKSVTQNYSFRIDYFDAQGNLRNSETRETTLGHWDLCVHVFDNLPEGIENFHLTELSEAESHVLALCA